MAASPRRIPKAAMGAYYSKGYQDALAEVKAKWELEGAEAALGYIVANLSGAE